MQYAVYLEPLSESTSLTWITEQGGKMETALSFQTLLLTGQTAWSHIRDDGLKISNLKGY
jgi:hypothetical protein